MHAVGGRKGCQKEFLAYLESKGLGIGGRERAMIISMLSYQCLCLGRFPSDAEHAHFFSLWRP